jgi:predicted AAA+ superfamily ATPase
VTGVRRCGKSSLLDLFEEYLLGDGVSANAIVRMNFEYLEFEDIRDYKSLNTYVKDRLRTGGTTYILLDEVQLVHQWEKAVNSLRLAKNTDIYLTGSNAWLLSSELSTLLSGRYMEIRMLPLSFSEFIDFNGYSRDSSLEELFNRYIAVGGFPGVTELRDHKPFIGPFLNGIYNTVIMKDVVHRGNVRDPALLDSVVRFIAGNVGNLISTKKVGDYLTSAGRKTTSDTIDNYLRLLENAFILYRARRYDMKSKLHLKTHEKFYFVDTGIRGSLIVVRNNDYGFLLENIVYFELLRRGYEVAVGKLGTLEVDFVATKPDKIVYYQVTATMLDEEVRERELKPLKSIPDNYEKVVLSMYRTPVTDYDGI